MMKRILVACLVLYSALSMQGQELPLKLIDGANLLVVKNGIQKKDATYVPAYNKLISEANKELKKTIASVMDKTMVAPSGDKHDYVSMGPYWWPDPSKPNGIPYMRKDGQRNPETEKLDRNPLGKMMNNVKTLAYAYYFSNDEKYASKATEYLHIWFINKDTKMNPHLEYGQMVPGKYNNRGRAEGLIDTYGFVEMFDAIRILETSKSLKAEDVKVIKEWFASFLTWMQTSDIAADERNALNNHGLAYDVQLAAIALFIDRKDVALEVSKAFAENRLFKQIEPDGSMPLELARTMAFHYTNFNIIHSLDMCALAKNVGVDIFHATSPDGRNLSKAIAFILPYIDVPQSAFPYQQIREFDNCQENLSWILRRAYQFDNQKNYLELFNKNNKSPKTDIRFLLIP